MAHHTSRQLTLDQKRLEDYAGSDHTTSSTDDDGGWEPDFDEYGPTMERPDPLLEKAAANDCISAKKLIERRRLVARGFNPEWVSVTPARRATPEQELAMANEHTKHTHTASAYPITKTERDT